MAMGDRNCVPSGRLHIQKTLSKGGSGSGGRVRGGGTRDGGRPAKSSYSPTMHSLFVAFALLTPSAVGLTELELAAALRGEVALRTETVTGASGKAAGRGVGAIVIERSIGDVWATVSRYDDKAEYQPRLQKVEVLERRPGLLRVRMEVDATITTARYTGHFRLDEREHSISWTLDRSATDNTVADIDGGYRMFEISPRPHAAGVPHLRRHRPFGPEVRAELHDAPLAAQPADRDQEAGGERRDLEEVATPGCSRERSFARSRA